MPKVTQLINVAVIDRGKIGEKRKVSVELEAPSDLFCLSDLLAQEAAVQSLKTILAAAARQALAEYAGSGKKMVRGATKGKGAQIGKSKNVRTQDKSEGALSA